MIQKYDNKLFLPINSKSKGMIQKNDMNFWSRYKTGLEADLEAIANIAIATFNPRYFEEIEKLLKSKIQLDNFLAETVND